MSFGLGGIANYLYFKGLRALKTEARACQARMTGFLKLDAQIHRRSWKMHDHRFRRLPTFYGANEFESQV